MREQKIANSGIFIRDDGTVRKRSWEITRGYLHRAYRRVSWHDDITKNPRMKNVHTLVAKAFVHNPRPDLFKQVDHINHVKDDNCSSNLRWVDDELNKVNHPGECVKFNKRRPNRPWRSRPKGMKSISFATREEAVESSRRRKSEV